MTLNIPEIPAELTIAVGKVGFQVRRWLQSVDFGLVRSGVSTLNRPESVASVRDLRTLGVGLTSPILDELRPARFVWTKLARFVPVWFFFASARPLCLEWCCWRWLDWLESDVRLLTATRMMEMIRMTQVLLLLKNQSEITISKKL